MTPDRNHNPTKGVDEWPLPRLSLAHRKRIKALLLIAHAAFLRADFRDPYKFIQPMEQVFSEIANLLFSADLLTVELLENQLRLLIVESAVAGGWLYVAKEEPLVEIFPGYLGHASTWERFDEH